MQCATSSIKGCTSVYTEWKVCTGGRTLLSGLRTVLFGWNAHLGVPTLPTYVLLERKQSLVTNLVTIIKASTPPSYKEGRTDGGTCNTTSDIDAITLRTYIHSHVQTYKCTNYTPQIDTYTHTHTHTHTYTTRAQTAERVIRAGKKEKKNQRHGGYSRSSKEDRDLRYEGSCHVPRCGRSQIKMYTNQRMCANMHYIHHRMQQACVRAPPPHKKSHIRHS